ncbi:MAG: ribulose-phosphate 3-epimerase [Eggerthellaceae bacterium]|jgi:ribulose-phosphate 3-epimerase
MYQPIAIAPSILSADFMNMERSIRTIEEGGAGFVHVDVMDGHFVPNLTMGVPLVKQLKKTCDLPLDVHLMIDNPLVELPWFLDAQPDLVTVHAEALSSVDLARAVAQIHEAGSRAAVALKPKTPVDVVVPLIESLDMVLVMSVEPGFSGQKYIVGSDGRVAAVAALAKEANPDLLIEVDGGIGVATAPLVCAAGADVLVCGSAVFGADDPAQAVRDVKAAGDAARTRALGER